MLTDIKKIKHIVSEHEKWLKNSKMGRNRIGRRAGLSGVNLSGVNFRKVFLTKDKAVLLGQAQIWSSNFSKADLREVNFFESDLSRSDLSGADLRQVTLSNANLSNVNLRGADLSGASLHSANLSGANLSGANLSNASLWNSILAYIDLQATHGLETVNHGRPSVLGLDTLRKSQGKIPKIFLRGCGLQDWEIEMAKLYQRGISSKQFTDQIYKMHEKHFERDVVYYSVFISYSHKDRDFAKTLHDDLQDSGIRCWLDEKEVLPGDDLHKEIDRGIRLWDKTLLCCSEHSMTSWWVDKELDTAFDKERELWQEKNKEIKKIIPLNLDGYILRSEWKHKHKAKLIGRTAANFTSWQDKNSFKETLNLLKKALMTEDAGREPPPVSRF